MSDDIYSSDDLISLFGSIDEAELERRARLNAEWTTIVSLRDTLGLSYKGYTNKNATYNQAIDMGRIVFPELFNIENSLLLRQKLGLTAREYVQLAEASQRAEGRVVTPEDLLVTDILKYKGLLEEKNIKSDVNLLKRKLKMMQEALEELQKSKSMESDLIYRDAFQVERHFPVSHRGENYKEFQIAQNKYLRLRVLHPNKAEFATGVDLIYENYLESFKDKLVRLAAIQYKIWDNKSLRIDKRAEEQVDKMERTFCHNNMCSDEIENKNGYTKTYRLPYCSAFLRPTDKLQSADSAFISTGYYVPVCIVKRFWKPAAKSLSLRAQDIRNQAVTHNVFEEMFNMGMLGSKWLTYEELEDLYHNAKVLEIKDHIIIHAQELPY